jgi:heme a synthase
VLALVVAVFRSRPKGHPARGGAVWSLVFILVEAAVGAGIVLLHLVGQNQSLGRAAFMAVHLVNTFFLLGALALTAHWCSDGAAVRWRGAGSLGKALLVSLGGLMLVGASGAVAALGDTLFPSSSLSAALGQDLSATAHVLVRLRLLHPFIAIAVAVGLLATCYRVVQREDADSARRATWTAALVLFQLIAGLVNVALLAPVWMQIVHLLLADLVWISLVLLTATVLAAGRARESALAA